MIWCNGELVEGSTLAVDITDRGLILGDGLFETVKVSAGRPLFLAKHLARLRVSGRVIDLAIDGQWIRRGVMSLLKAHHADCGVLRITMTRGPGPRGLAPVPADTQQPVAMISFTKTDGRTHEQTLPDRLVEAPFIRSSAAMTSSHKTLSYADNLAAMAFAKNKRAADVLFFNERGEATCTAMANIFVHTGLGYATPPLSAGVLPGVVRAVLIEAAEADSIPVDIRPLNVEDVRDRLVLRTNSLIGVRPAWFDDGRQSLRPDLSEDYGMLASLYSVAEQREEAV